MKDNRLKGIIALAVVTVLSFGAVYGSKALTKDKGASNEKTNTTPEESVEGSIDVSGQEGIDAARELTDASGTVTGYAVTSGAKGFAGKVTLEVTFGTDAQTIEGVKVVSHTETPGYGANLENEDYLAQFNGIPAPVYLPGNAPVAAEQKEAAKEPAEETAKEPASTELKDGVYSVKADTAEQGYLSTLTLKVEDGAVTSVVWDASNELGEYKSYLSTVGEYKMTDDGPTWKEQADALAAYVVEKQSAEGFAVDENGKTDTVAGVSISVDGFIDLTEKALKLAASGEGAEAAEEPAETASAGTEIDAVSGATFTSNAIVESINKAYEFIHAYAAK
ncbi:MAG: FMN-binding protein [Lachnospiraceae bacterium]|jgi:Na+-translocating ferredoxin:NAD+ oxidoreductase RnfG subunit|nr:FMN-binding protein [Lachnospiraceae bacterium]